MGDSFAEEEVEEGGNFHPTFHYKSKLVIGGGPPRLHPLEGGADMALSERRGDSDTRHGEEKVVEGLNWCWNCLDWGDGGG